MTRAEKAWLDAITALGCIVCKTQHNVFTPSEPHHLLSGGRRISHQACIPLCVNHHRSGVNNAEYVSRHPFRREFEARYGSEHELLSRVRAMVEEMA